MPRLGIALPKDRLSAILQQESEPRQTHLPVGGFAGIATSPSPPGVGDCRQTEAGMLHPPGSSADSAGETGGGDPHSEVSVTERLGHGTSAIADRLPSLRILQTAPARCRPVNRCLGVSNGRTQDQISPSRAIHLGPAAQQILAKYLLGDAKAFCFSPAEPVTQTRAPRRKQHRS